VGGVSYESEAALTSFSGTLAIGVPVIARRPTHAEIASLHGEGHLMLASFASSR
jgi:hypothetical protein